MQLPEPKYRNSAGRLLAILTTFEGKSSWLEHISTMFLGVGQEKRTLQHDKVKLTFAGLSELHGLYDEFLSDMHTVDISEEERKVLVVECKPSERRPCFLDAKSFYVRTNPATDMLEGPKLYEYLKQRFDT